MVDQEAVASQVQLVLSRDLARQVIKDLKLAEQPEFDPVLQRRVGCCARSLGVLGLAKDPLKMTPEERVLEAYYDRLTAFAVDKSRVISIEFTSADPELAAKVANAVAETYLDLQQAAKHDQTRVASQWLGGEIETLRKRVAEAEAQGRGLPLEVEPVRRHQQHHAVEPAARRAQLAARDRALAEGGVRGQGAS